MTFIKAHWLDVLAWVCLVTGTINMIGGIVTWDAGEMALASLALIAGCCVLERKP